MATNIPTVFISYSWDDDSHKSWVRELADNLIENGIDVYLDQYDLEFGDRLPEFMEQKITNSDFVLIICTENYKLKSDKRKSGVGYEGHIISAELLSSNNEKKFIPILRSDEISKVMPVYLAGKLGIQLSDEISIEDNSFQDLLTTLYGVKRKPKLGSVPNFIKEGTSVSNKSKEIEEIKIEGIITNEVTVPKMDGTVGSALYKIPFRLNRSPSSLWSELFLKAWASPPRWTTMHRFDIASVLSDKIILDGTTIEEVKKYHRDTLKLCVEQANQEERNILEMRRLEQEKEEARVSEHYDKISQLSDEIDFDW
ncbi:toll/interleukin-1 receptor domain-containing protein [Streptococcus mutans]|jgi:SEFIR domain family|uniref:toll/interleukin-1 receptor domain-containing protein n=2 Tax=Streptococcus mutans TaxID=1309 RepID=UPI0002B58879|nr:toll/interleukin-1 receptor domain-containing protein [Streptococcus mutans]EMC03823.1 hypothetical protein SMU69_09049 [Streptococcus mutans NLML4]MCB5081100.1 toll/interleukin-1 receptor domain-containing protein [Streptococcus mutans]MCB5095093.1 toll/interleukin-1 receptor domain-containing protein [Streptococcus mutans]MCB5112952.1 toll/interleukin-1 receptor domain-containing protein [Streptococcus mutans]NLQ71027.1 TIR domain-containing protein [Streptococcus mutans]